MGTVKMTKLLTWSLLLYLLSGWWQRYCEWLPCGDHQWLLMYHQCEGVRDAPLILTLPDLNTHTEISHGWILMPINNICIKVDEFSYCHPTQRKLSVHCKLIGWCYPSSAVQQKVIELAPHKKKKKLIRNLFISCVKCEESLVLGLESVTVMAKNVSTLGKFDQRRLWKWICIVNPFDLLFKQLKTI